MTELTRPIKRKTPATILDRSKHRNVIASIEPARGTAVVGIRLHGTRQTYRVAIESVYHLAVRHHVDKIERRARELKNAGIPLRTARVKARKEMEAELS